MTASVIYHLTPMRGRRKIPHSGCKSLQWTSVCSLDRWNARNADKSMKTFLQHLIRHDSDIIPKISNRHTVLSFLYFCFSSFVCTNGWMTVRRSGDKWLWSYIEKFNVHCQPLKNGTNQQGLFDILYPRPKIECSKAYCFRSFHLPVCLCVCP